uniref:thermonuclease family protein n=1 Tax=Roseovarius indicus TaxID=540747 RepID=UPI003B51E0FA
MPGHISAEEVTYLDGMLFLLRPSPSSVLGRIISSVRSAILVGLALVTVPYLSAWYEPRQGATSVHTVANQPSGNALRGGDALAGIRPVSREEGLALNGKRLAGQVTHVRDGDTVEIAGVPVRIANLDCAEKGTSEGERATRVMLRLASAGPLACNLTGKRSHDREVGTCRMADGRDIGQLLISEGVCGRWQ